MFFSRLYDQNDQDHFFLGFVNKMIRDSHFSTHLIMAHYQCLYIIMLVGQLVALGMFVKNQVRGVFRASFCHVCLDKHRFETSPSNITL